LKAVPMTEEFEVKIVITNRFHYAREAGQNPHSGFMSFQHFRGEKLYSDIVVRPEARMTETERVECYPVSADAEENGREQGYYPDSTVVYIRILWKEFEPEKGKYNYDFIQSIIDEAKRHGQTLIFRLMAHSTRACDDVPAWLKEIMPCPERPPMERVKDSPTDPRFMEYFLEAIRALGARFDSDPVFESIDISLPGSWGEGHNLHLYPDNLFETIMDTYLEAFPHTQLMTQIGRPELIAYAAERGRIVGWRGDGLGEPHHLQELYPSRIEKVAEQWKIAPVSFEAYWWLGEWERKGWDIDKIIETTLSWHLSSFNGKSMPVPEMWKEKVDGWTAKMGYHFVIDSFTLPEVASAGETVDMILRIDNVGVAPVYKKIPLLIRIGQQKLPTDIDVTHWLPGKHEEQIYIKVPNEAGVYDVSIGFEYDLPVYFASDAKREENFYGVGKITVNK